MTTVVLGWDGLDYSEAKNFGLLDRFGEHHREIKTFKNPVLEKPHTYELWPSMITGLTPDEHGIHADDYTHGGSWSSTWLNIATKISKHTVPDRLRWFVGRKIRARGHTFDMEGADYYSQNKINTLFDDYRSVPVTVPNYRSEIDEEIGMSSDRGAELAKFLNIDSDEAGNTVHRPEVSLAVLEQRLSSEVGQKLGIATSAIDREVDIVFIWLGYLDTVGHLAPVVNSEDWKRRAYEQAAEWTDFIKSQLTNSDTLISVSDHGLLDGAHSQHAYFGADTESVVDETTSILDVRDGIESVISQGGHKKGEDGTSTDEAKEVKGRLEDLGYI